ILEDIKDLSINDLLKLANDISRVKIGDVKDDDITLYLFTQSMRQPIIINNDTKNAIDLNKPTKFIIHGWIANSRRSWCKKGYKIAQLVIDVEIPPRNIHFVGHSLGAHISGFAAKKINEITSERVSRISGLDPAGPHFREYASVNEERLDKEDANVVDVIHTDAGTYGIDFPIGTLDIYVNGLRPQPGCLDNFNLMSFGDLIEHSYCNHARSTTYFHEWINKGKFYCKLCSSWENFLMNKCHKTLVFGEEDVNENVTGICVTRTHYHEPFLYN
ncbi:hypothetical protein NQ314_002501, partial [Rhamnusium bicolor]